MKKTIICVAILAVASCGLANETDVEVTVEGSLLIKGKALKQVLHGKAIAAQPSWDPLKDKCPVDGHLVTRKFRKRFVL